MPSFALPGTTLRASISSSERQANGPTPASSVPDTTSPKMSQDGLSVGFSSDASNLVAKDTNRVADVFVRNLVTGKTQRVSVSSSEAQANGPSYSPALNVYGDIIAFVSEATNLVARDTNGVADVFVRNLKEGTTRRISVDSGERQANGPSNTPFVSLFGRWITFDSSATNLDGFDTNGMPDAHLRDLKAGTTTRIKPPALRQEEPRLSETTWTSHAQVSYDGRIMSFVRKATRNVPRTSDVSVPLGTVDQPSTSPLPIAQPVALSEYDDGIVPSAIDLFLTDRKTKKTRMVVIPSQAVPVTGRPLKMMSDHPALSADGRFVAFESWSVLDADDALVRYALDYKDVLLYDRVSKVFAQKSISTWGVPGNGDSTRPSVNAGGTIVSFLSDATNLVPGDTNGVTDAFVRDAPARSTSRASQARNQAESTVPAGPPSISYEGRRIVFMSTASNLTAGDTNGVSDVFVRDRQTNTPNTGPIFRKLPGIRTISISKEYSIQLKAHDLDNDPIRYGVIISVAPNVAAAPLPSSMPDGATLDPLTGLFRWTPRANQSGPWTIVFTAEDPRGGAQKLETIVYAEIVVRTISESARCIAVGGCST